MIDLPALLNVDSTHVEKKVETILNQDKDLTLVDGEIISSYVSSFLLSPSFPLLPLSRSPSLVCGITIQMTLSQMCSHVLFSLSFLFCSFLVSVLPLCARCVEEGIVINRHLTTRFYADRIVAEISEGLAESGQVVTQTLGARFGLGTAFLEKILTKKIASGKLKAQLQNGVSPLSPLYLFSPPILRSPFSVTFFFSLSLC